MKHIKKYKTLVSVNQLSDHSSCLPGAEKRAKQNVSLHFFSRNAVSSWTSEFEIWLCTAHFTFQHPQDDIPVVHAGSVEADCVIRPDGEGQWQSSDLAEGAMVPLCGHLWHCSQNWSDILLHLLN